MKYPELVDFSDVLKRRTEFDAIIDVRSESEFAIDHIANAINCPVLNDAERVTIGTMYKQVGSFEAKRLGAALVAKNIGRHIEEIFQDKGRDWKPLIYCWRGGNRSGSLATILSAIGFQVTLIEGGYKASRNALVESLPSLVQRLRYKVVCGPTGSGKTRLLQALAAQGAQVLDLEGLASHRSSVLGLIPGQPQPSQKRFDTLVWEALHTYDPARVVYVESESKKVGNLRVPDALIDAMRASPCLDLQLPLEERVALLMEDYEFFLRDSEFFCERLRALTELRGKAVIDEWVGMVQAGRSDTVVRELLDKHYDPVYAASIRRNFVQYGQALPCPVASRSEAAMAALARDLIAQESADMA